MHHFFTEPSQIGEKEIRITGSDVNHIRNVLRMRPGEEVLVSDGQGRDYRCKLRRGAWGGQAGSGTAQAHGGKAGRDARAVKEKAVDGDRRECGQAVRTGHCAGDRGSYRLFPGPCGSGGSGCLSDSL